MEFEHPMTDRDLAVMAVEQAAIEAELREEAANQVRVMNTIKSAVSDEVYADIVLYLSDCGITCSYLITDQPRGRPEEDADWAFGSPCVDQTCTGGYDGDTYAGTVSIPLGDDRFFQFSYTM